MVLYLIDEMNIVILNVYMCILDSPNKNILIIYLSFRSKILKSKQWNKL